MAHVFMMKPDKPLYGSASRGLLLLTLIVVIAVAGLFLSGCAPKEKRIMEVTAYCG